MNTRDIFNERLTNALNSIFEQQSSQLVPFLVGLVDDEIYRCVSDSRTLRWISVKHKLPATNTQVLVTIKDETSDNTNYFTAVGWIAALTATDPIWIVDNDARRDITYWAALPGPYKGECE